MFEEDTQFAEIDPASLKVLRVLVVPESEAARAEEYLSSDLGLGGMWRPDPGACGRRASAGDVWDPESGCYREVPTEEPEPPAD